MVGNKCKLCNKEYKPERTSRVSFYCSRRCSALANPLFMRGRKAVNKIVKDCVCGKKFLSYLSDKRKYCSRKCYHKSLLKYSPKLGLSINKRAKFYRKNNYHNYHDNCPDCNGLKLKTAKRCIVCKGKATSGINSPYYKGGYENHLWHNKKRRIKEMNAKGSHSLEQWQELKKKYDYMCLCCKEKEPFIVLSEDHIIPLSKNGSDNIENIQPLCRSCNSRKYNKIINYVELHNLTATIGL